MKEIIFSPHHFENGVSSTALLGNVLCPDAFFPQLVCGTSFILNCASKETNVNKDTMGTHFDNAVQLMQLIGANIVFTLQSWGQSKPTFVYILHDQSTLFQQMDF